MISLKCPFVRFGAEKNGEVLDNSQISGLSKLVIKPLAEIRK